MAAPMRKCKSLVKSYKYHSFLQSNGRNKAYGHLKFLSANGIRHFGQPAAQTHPHLVRQGEVTPGITKEEYKQRRNTLVSNAANQLSSTINHILIFPSANKVYMTYDIPYPFRQNTEFLYLCGFQEPDSVLVLQTTSAGYKSVLFVPKRDPDKELWDGPRSGDTGAIQITGVSESLNTEDLEKHLYEYCKTHSDYMVWYDFNKPVHGTFHSNVIEKFLKQNGKKGMESPKQLVHKQRVVKSAAEIELMRKTTNVASLAFIETMRYSYPEINEAHLYAKMDFECRIRNAEFLAYPPVIAGGNRANTIHYIRNDQLINDGDLVLMDAGCEYHGYTSDITRTWPVSGKYSPSQRRLYLSLLHVQESLIRMCTTDYSLNEIHNTMMELLATQLVQLNIIPSSSANNSTKLRQATLEFCPHHVGHYLGMDVHDTTYISKNIKLQPGMILTIEPGIYINESNADVPQEYRGIGIRIEDDVLVTPTTPQVLTEACPKHPDDIEKIMAQKGLV